MAKEAALIGGRMRERRDELGLSQREVAEKIPGSAQGADVSRWERGLHRPNSDTLGHIAEVLGITVADLHAGPVAERQERGPAPDPFATESGATADDVLAEIRALRLELLAEIGKVRTAQEDQRQRQGTGSRRKGQSGS